MGSWGGLVYPLTPGAQTCVEDFRDFLSGNGFCLPWNDLERHHIVVANPSVPREAVCPAWLPRTDYHAWVQFHRRWLDAYERFVRRYPSVPLRQATRSGAFTFSWPRTAFASALLSATSHHEEPLQFFAVVMDDSVETGHMRLLALNLFLSTTWHVAHGGLLLHSAAVARTKDGFLFLGDSEAGKTSVACLSASAGHQALGDDLNLLIRDGSRGYLLAGAPSPRLSPVGYANVQPPLRCIFKLMKDKRDYVIPLPPLSTARILLQALLQTPFGRRLPDEAMERAFSTACDIAREVPGYELHFRKRPDFWRVIDQQIPA